MRRLNQSRAQSTLWLLETLNVPYDLKTFQRDKKDKLAPPELKAIHPLGKSPVISIERPEYSKPLVVAESGAIFEYLLSHYGGAEKGLIPPRYASEEDEAKNVETEAYLRYRYFMYYVEGSLMPHLVMSLVVDGTNPLPPFTRIFC